jgi:3-oxoacyl-[acyl-carrier protein] reductase
MMKLKGAKVLLTGATGGLGREAALAFAETGATVYALDIQKEKGAALEQAAADLGVLHYVHQDLRDQEGLRRSLESLVARNGGIDVLINNAATYPAKPFEQYSIEEYRAVQQVNVEAGIVCTQVLIPGMKRHKHGRIINIASITFYGGWPNLYPYVASKAALVGLTRAWAREFGPFGVTVNAISVGAIPTDAEKIHPDPEGYNRFVLEHQSLKRRGQPTDIARVMIFLASDYAGFMTGQLLNVDGGWVMQ